MAKQKQPWKTICAGGREFKIYREYDDLVEHDVGIYPDFEEHPEYTCEGRPFATSDRDGCPCCKPKKPDKDPAGDCGGCTWFHREETPWDIIGVCMCEELRHGAKEGSVRDDK